MAEIINLKTIYKKQGASYIRSLFSEDVIITEKINAVRFCFKKTKNGFEFFNKSGKISLIDRTISMLYEYPINHIENLSDSIISNIPDEFIFGMRYFYSNKPGSIEYENLPKNRLVLTDIRDDNGFILDDTEKIEDYSNLLSIDKIPILFEGKLDEVQKIRLLEFLRLDDKQLEVKLNGKSMSKYLFNIIDPKIKNSFLSNDISDIDAIIFKFKEASGNSIYTKISDVDVQQNRETKDLYELILINFIEFISKNTTSIKKNDSRSFIEGFCKIFNLYVDHLSSIGENLNLKQNPFAEDPAFSVNLNLLENEKTKEILRDESIECLFQYLLTNIYKPKKKFKLLGENLKGQLNDCLYDNTDVDLLTYNEFIRFI